MKNKELFKEAIADAQAVRKVALANAKAALEEALTPQIQAMFASKLQEMEDDELNESEEQLDEELDLDEILNELESEDSIDEAKDEEKKDKDEKKPEPKKSESKPKEPKEEKPEEGGFEAGEELGTEEATELVKDLSVEELKAIISDIVMQTVGTGAEAGLGADMNPDLGEPAIGGLEGEGDIYGSEGGSDDFEGEFSTEQGAEGTEDELDLDELLKEFEGLNETEEIEEGEDAVKAELNEAVKTINILRKQLSEVNLLNAKLLYVNRIFKAKNLNEAQKIRVIETLDKAESAKEAKLVYESLIVSMNSDSKITSKQPIKESLGFASKPTGVAVPKGKIVEDETIKRFQKLANIK